MTNREKEFHPGKKAESMGQEKMFAAKKLLIVLLALGMIFWLSACATRPGRPLETSPDAPTARQLADRFLTQSQNLAGFKGLGRFQARNGEELQAGRMAWMGESPDRFRVEVLSPFGTPVYSLASDGEIFYALDRSTGEVVSTRAGGSVLSRALGVDINPDHLVPLLAGQPPMAGFSRARLEGRESGGPVLVLTGFWGQKKQELWLSDDLSQVEKTVFYAWGDKKGLEVLFNLDGKSVFSWEARSPGGAFAKVWASRFFEDAQVDPAGFRLEKAKGAGDASRAE